MTDNQALPRRPLRVTWETMRALTDGELRLAAGGGRAPNTYYCTTRSPA
jgi:hypothetical protein